ncbi:SH3 domain protein [Aspergillus clavatus NRRL 1]|uniref:RING finger domain protein n=1 Tax=Aspergillus clavatus (strain ATCC 1007 / CBS 513.65 / DSM 816 / NCTC 3887 / NRRL 1 / QM 1276 / 107) TaxID=344612 RepID=A1C7H0_ASPCL|nr:RING finger domain protein [Aspergillus clavatus NRRL 1]EAW14341.1 RING finger domain protein [Aspergillus clavatus NRRL 1]
MSTVPPGGPGLLDLEKELTCSICTELLYQPLTLLDCLHTFCGSCLKEWFATQASRRRSSSTPRFTCPSCRAVVRETRPNATVTTLLDMVLSANPDREKPADEKEEIAQKYKHGESIFPVASSPEQSGAGSDEDDRRLLEEVRELSLQESRAQTRESSRRTAQSSRTRRAESVDADGRRSDGRSRRRREEERVSRRHPNTSEDSAERTRRIEHQSSLRSLLSLSDTETMQEEILRQILEDGLLNDIDLDNLGPAQEEELTERIADAYRRRHMRGPSSRQRQEAEEASRTSDRPRARSQSVQRPPTTSAPQASSRSPPVSRPYLLEPLVSRSGASGHQRRLSDQGSRRRRTSPVLTNAASSSEVTLRPAARSSSDMISDRPRPSQSSRTRVAEALSAPRPRRATASEQNVPNIFTAESRSRDPRHAISGRPQNSFPTSVASPATPGSSFSARLEQSSLISSACSSLAPAVNGSVNQRSRPSSSRSNASQLPPATFVEPSIACDRCGKQNIQYDLHKNCIKCKDGAFNLCLRCYRLGRGCLQWAGFGPSAEANFQRMIASSTGHTPPSRETRHILQSSKYLRPSSNARQVSSEGREMTSDDPSQRLQNGLFCDICRSSADQCYWKCNKCNEGDWGFCNRCVNQGRCCTHPLLPICRLAPNNRSNVPTSAGITESDGPDHSSTPPGSADRANETFKILSFSTNCDICTSTIPASATRLHCLECHEGDYDVCANCYLRLVATGKISKEDGLNGWRRCPKGHRMVVVGFDNHNEGLRRVVVRDLVGGRALKDEHLPHHPASPPPSTTQFAQSPAANGSAAVPSPELGSGDWSWKEGGERRKKASRTRAPWSATDSRSTAHPSTTTHHPNTGSGSGSGSETATPTSPVSPTVLRRFPPDGGVGLIVHALWSWYPEDQVQDELMFPRGAEITEAENINDDWFWGCYAGSTGLFPGSHVAVVGEIV